MKENRCKGYCYNEEKTKGSNGMKGYKAFGKGMVCRGKQYEENKIFEEDEAKVCQKGMHFCKRPLDVLDYYPLVDEDGNMAEFAEVEALDNPVTDDNKKYCSKKLKIGEKISFAKLVQAEINFERGKTKDTKTKTTSKNNVCIGSSGDCARIGSSGDSARIGSSGNLAQIGSSGDSAKIGSSGNSARIGSSGNSARIGSSGDWAQIGSSGKNCVICCAGNGCKAKGKIGSWITLSEWDIVNGERTPIFVKTEKIDGDRIKEDTFYMLENGEFVEVK